MVKIRGSELANLWQSDWSVGWRLSFTFRLARELADLSHSCSLWESFGQSTRSDIYTNSTINLFI